jgi:pantetheine-phosphate adenylyltransferase
MVQAIYPGSFDPVTMGHLDIIRRSADVFERVYVAVAINVSKRPLFTVEQRVEMLEHVTREYANVEIVTFQGLLIEAAKKYQAKVIVKGLRAISDFEYEFQMALMNKKLGHETETLFMTTSSKYSFLSSSLVKEVALLGGCIKDLVPDEVHARIIERIRTDLL